MARNFVILGHPLGHSMSAPIHTRLFALSGSEGAYGVLDLAPEELERHWHLLDALYGYNVTIPYKLAVIPHLDRLDETARRYGAVNVVANTPERVGYNTDCYGFCKTIEQLGADLSQSVCILGAGGVGRMFAIESALQGAAVTLAVLPNAWAKAEAVVRDIQAQRPGAPVRIVDITRLAGLDGPFHLLINATPAGMYPQVDGMPIGPELLSRCSYVFDSIYNPTKTRLLRAAEQAGCRCAGGMAMLVWQAVRAHEIWDRASYRTEDIAALIAEMSARVDRDFAR